MKFGKKLLAAFFLLAQFASAPANAYVLLPEPPATGFVMNLDLPTTQFQTLGYGLTSWSKLAEGALASWNGAGIGSGPDFNFFKITNPVVAGDACDRDGVNEVRFAADNCGFSYGDALAVTFRWIVNGVRVEEDVIFDTNPPGGWNAYAGLLRRASNGSDTLNDFVRVAIHEFGHAAGLNHPDQAGQSVAAIMNSRVSNVDALQTDDINGAHAIKWSLVSGAGATSSTTTSTTSTTKTTTTASTTTSVGPTTTTTLSGSGQISMQNYFPFQAGNEWIYQDEIGGVVTTYKRTVGQTPVSIKGVATIAWADSDGVTRYMTNDANGIRRFANSSQEFVAGFGNVSFNSTYTPPELYAPALVQLGSSVTQTGSITLTASDGSSRTDTFSQTIGFSSDSVSVPAGTFAAVRLTIVRTVSGATSTNTIWAADGVGIVKFKFDDGTGAVETVSLASINFTSAPGAAKLNLIPGFNLVGNGAAAAVNVAAAFGDAQQSRDCLEMACRQREVGLLCALAGRAGAHRLHCRQGLRGTHHDQWRRRLLGERAHRVQRAVARRRAGVPQPCSRAWPPDSTWLRAATTRRRVSSTSRLARRRPRRASSRSTSLRCGRGTPRNPTGTSTPPVSKRAAGWPHSSPPKAILTLVRGRSMRQRGSG